MKINFDDKSYIEFTLTDGIIMVALCGLKDKNQLTVSAAKLTIEEAKQILTFFKQFE